MTHLMPIENAQVEDVRFHSGEHRLAGQVFRPAGAPRAVVVLNAATGVPARFYVDFARWLSEDQNLACLIYDYRDFGASRNRHPRQSTATMADWGVHDQQAARDFARGLFPNTPLWVIGHSLGAICLPFQRNLDQIDRFIAVATGLVHTRDHPWPYQALARFFWFGPIPLIAAACGYLPAKTLRLGADLPAGVYWQWRRWCTRRDFYARDFGRDLPYPDVQGLTAPSKFVVASDDVMTPPKTTWRLMQCFPASFKTQKVLRPADFGLHRIGHIDVFAKKNAAAWSEIFA